jgi:hypothetical protein
VRNVGTGLGITAGAALGIVVGPLLFTDWWWAPLLGAGVGLLVGAAVDARSGSDA